MEKKIYNKRALINYDNCNCKLFNTFKATAFIRTNRMQNTIKFQFDCTIGIG